MKKIFVALLLGAFTLSFSQSAYYNDYRSSITGINWQTLAAELLLTPSQKQQLFALNNRYDDYGSWSRVYGDNPDRWRTDRYGEMERIFGKEKYTKFKNRYYKGQNPVAVYNRNKNNNKRYENNRYDQNRDHSVVNKKFSGYNTSAAKRYQAKNKNSVKTYPVKSKSSVKVKAVSHGKSNGKGKK